MRTIKKQLEDLFIELNSKVEDINCERRENGLPIIERAQVRLLGQMSLLSNEHLAVESLDPESALVSKAVKAPEKNKQLIREAIASEKFPKLVDRIILNGGNLRNFA